jgi:hypothetical protein
MWMDVSARKVLFGREGWKEVRVEVWSTYLSVSQVVATEPSRSGQEAVMVAESPARASGAVFTWRLVVAVDRPGKIYEVLASANQHKCKVKCSIEVASELDGGDSFASHRHPNDSAVSKVIRVQRVFLRHIPS